MKRTHYAPWALLLVAAAMLLSCNLMGLGSGTLSITVPDYVLRSDGAASKALPSSGTATARFIRVYLEERGSLVPLAGKTVYEAPISAEGLVEIPGVAPVRDANIYLALSVSGGSDFRAFRYAKNKALFSVVAGGTTFVQMVPANSPFADTSLLTDAVKGVRSAIVGGTQYYLANGVLSWTDALEQPHTLSVPGALSLTAGKLLDGEQPSAEQLWINTAVGIIPLVDGDLGPEMTGLEDKEYISEKKILESGIVSLILPASDGQPEETITAAYYQRPGSIGVAAYDGTIPGWDWIDLYDVLDPAGDMYQSGLESVQNLIGSNKGKLVADFFVDPGFRFGYLKTPLGAFRFGADLLDDLINSKTEITVDYVLNTVLKDATIKVPLVDGQAPDIQGLSWAGDCLYIGTNKGVFRNPTNPAKGSEGVPTLPEALALGRKFNVVKLEAKYLTGTRDAAKDGLWAAALGARGSLYLFKNDALVNEYKFYTGLPEFGGAAAATGDLFWTDAGLVVTGTNGAVLIANDKLGD